MASPFKPTGTFINPDHGLTLASAKRQPEAVATAVAVGSDGVDGVVEFPSQMGTQYRYKITSKHDTLDVWIEDRKTKKQWQTTKLKLSDFVTEDVVIPQASFQDYVTCFLNCFHASLTSEDFARDLIPAPDTSCDSWQLRLTLKIRVFISVWTPTYCFTLQQVPLDPVDILAAKMRDQEDYIRALEDQVHALTVRLDKPQAPPQPSPQQAQALPVFVRGILVDDYKACTLPWTCEQVIDEILFHARGGIRFAIGGVFVVQAMVTNTNTNNTTTLEMAVNGKCVVSCVDCECNGASHVSSIVHVLAVKANDEVTITYKGKNHAHKGSYVSIHQLR